MPTLPIPGILRVCCPGSSALHPSEPEPLRLDRRSVFMCVCGGPMRLPDNMFCTGYGFACLLLLPSACNQAKVQE